MKRFKVFFIILYILSMPLAAAHGADSLHIGLITCSPGTEVYSQYGHTAVRVWNSKSGADMVFNYGMFSSRQPYFIPRFIFGLTDYKVDVESFSSFLEEYRWEGRGVTEQVLNISPADKAAIAAALIRNVQPENQVYRYNFFYDNCTTRARDIIVKHLSGKLEYGLPASDDTYRDMIHRWNSGYPWTSAGEDILLGVNADRPTTKSQQQFLPGNLMNDFGHAYYNGHSLVESTAVLLKPQAQIVKDDFFLSPFDVSLILIAVFLTVGVNEYRHKKICWQFDAACMLISGLPGLILFTMIFSQHPCVSLNLLILILNPLTLFWLVPAVKHARKGEKYYWWTLWEIMLLAGILGSFVQKEPWLTIILAFCLLSRTLLHVTLKK